MVVEEEEEEEEEEEMVEYGALSLSARLPAQPAACGGRWPAAAFLPAPSWFLPVLCASPAHCPILSLSVNESVCPIQVALLSYPPCPTALFTRVAHPVRLRTE